MVRYSQALERATKRVLEDRKLSRREAEARSNVSYSVIEAMSKGRIPGADHVIQFAYSFDEDVVEWLQLCEYHEMAKIMENLKGSQNGGQLDGLLDVLPEPKRAKARETARKAILGLIVPMYAEVAA